MAQVRWLRQRVAASSLKASYPGTSPIGLALLSLTQRGPRSSLRTVSSLRLNSPVIPPGNAVPITEGIRPQPPVPDTWTTRALPFLRSAVARFETYGEATSEEIAADTGLGYRLLHETAFRLRDEGFLEFSSHGGGSFDVTGVTERGLTEVGAWPSPESLVERLLAALEKLAEEAPTEDDRSRAQRSFDFLQSLGRDVLTNAAGSALGGLAG